MRKPELLSPAGDLEKLKTAVLYGADAVYFGGEGFSLRAASRNFNKADMKEGIEFAHERGRRCYCAVNILARPGELAPALKVIEGAAELGADAFIISDLGLFSAVRRELPHAELHVSTQASCLNHESALMWHSLGAKRIILARELSLSEITEIRQKTPPDLDLEVFVHGAMCISYSGRCLLSNYMTGRDANAGKCAQPCRWKYYLREEKRPGQYFPIEEDEKGAFILNSRDLCMIEHIPELMAAGVTSFKIEGRVKSQYYVGAVTGAYRRAIDLWHQNSGDFTLPDELIKEVGTVSHRDYYTGFYFGDRREEGQIYKSSSYIREWDVVAVVEGYDEKSGLTLLSQRNRFFKGDELELMTWRGTVPFTATELYDGEGTQIEAAPHAEMPLMLRLPVKAQKGMMVRKKREEQGG